VPPFRALAAGGIEVGAQLIQVLAQRVAATVLFFGR
jgi:hypothetical protein